MEEEKAEIRNLIPFVKGERKNYLFFLVTIGLLTAVGLVLMFNPVTLFWKGLSWPISLLGAIHLTELITQVQKNRQLQRKQKNGSLMVSDIVGNLRTRIMQLRRDSRWRQFFMLLGFVFLFVGLFNNKNPYLLGAGTGLMLQSGLFIVADVLELYRKQLFIQEQSSQGEP